MMIKAVIFDLDGTLLDTIQDIANTGNRILKNRGYEPLSIKTYKMYVGKGVRHLLDKMIEHYMIPKHMFDDMLKDYYVFYKEESDKTTKVYDGMQAALKEMKNMGISISVLSNKPHEQVLDLMPKYFSDNIFDKTYGKHGGIKP